MKYYLGIDFGGGASKATLLGETGNITATNTVEYPTYYPQAGYVEQNPDDWYRAIRENIAALLKKSGVAPSEIAAVCLDAATHTAVLTDNEGKVLRPAIYWSDSRSIAECVFLESRYSDLILRQTLHKVDTIWTLPQLMWVKNNEPEIWSQVRKIFFPKDYIRFLLTGEYLTDYIEAEGSMLFDYNKQVWSDELCGIIGINKGMMPKVISPVNYAGAVTQNASINFGLCAGTPVICGTTDTALEVFASGAVNKGEMTVKLATAGRICVVTDKTFPQRHLINYSHIQKGLWYPGTATKSCAASYRWLRDTFGGDYRELDSAASGIPVGCEGLFFHPYLNGELTPYADPMLAGSFTGIRAAHGKGHFARAVMEGVAMSLMDCMVVLDKHDITHIDSANIIGGGAASGIWRQIVSDALGIRLIRKENSDSSFGGAMLAAVSTGAFSSLEEAVSVCSKVVSVTEPKIDNTQKFREIFLTYKKIHDALAPVYHEMCEKQRGG